MFEFCTLLVNTCVMLATLASVGITVYIFTRQQKLTFFERYTARYQHIMEKMPEVFFQDTKLQLKAKPEDIEKCNQYIRLYVDLCCEEYFLYTKHYIDEDVWNEWEEGISWAFTQNEMVKNYWNVENNQSGYSNFSDYVNVLQKEAEYRDKKKNKPINSKKKKPMKK